MLDCKMHFENTELKEMSVGVCVCACAYVLNVSHHVQQLLVDHPDDLETTETPQTNL